jgi:hypothetical protein
VSDVSAGILDLMKDAFNAFPNTTPPAIDGFASSSLSGRSNIGAVVPLEATRPALAD